MQAQLNHLQISNAAVPRYQLRMEINLRIREIRQERGLTLADVAGRIGVSIPHLSGVERGVKNINNHLLARLADALGVTPETLISGDRPGDLDAFLGVWNELNAEDRERVQAFADALQRSEPS